MKITNKFSLDNFYDKSSLMYEYARYGSYRCKKQGIIIWFLIFASFAAGSYLMFYIGRIDVPIGHTSQTDIFIFFVIGFGAIALCNLIALACRHGMLWTLLKNITIREFLKTVGYDYKKNDDDDKEQTLEVRVEIFPDDDLVELYQGSFCVRYRISDACFCAKTKRLILVGFFPTMHSHGNQFPVYSTRLGYTQDDIGISALGLDDSNWKAIPMRRGFFDGATEKDVIKLFKKDTAKNTLKHLLD